MHKPSFRYYQLVVLLKEIVTKTYRDNPWSESISNEGGERHASVYFYVLFFSRTCCLWKFPSQGSNLGHGCNQSHSSDHTRSLTHWAPNKLPEVYFRNYSDLASPCFICKEQNLLWLAEAKGERGLLERHKDSGVIIPNKPDSSSILFLGASDLSSSSFSLTICPFLFPPGRWAFSDPFTDDSTMPPQSWLCCFFPHNCPGETK